MISRNSGKSLISAAKKIIDDYDLLFTATGECLEYFMDWVPEQIKTKRMKGRSLVHAGRSLLTKNLN